MSKERRLKLSRLAFGLGLTMLATPALARLNPTPPPSGIVVHLFGPNSITSHVLPSFAVPAGGGPAGAGPAGTVPAGAGAAGAAAAAAANARTDTRSAATAGAQNAAYPEPTMGQVLHQMFVVGDPTKTPAQILAPGRAAEHPLATNP